jgi:A/G-specific adenine glycosylase
MIWLSEVILQQTRVAQGTPYFIRFYNKFPDVFSLAQAPIDDVIKAWEGLGYYSRARNLHAAAQTIVQVYNGVFPQEYQEIIKLKGVGPYTAAAIASFSFGLPYPVVDGNVIRLVSRILGITEPVDRPEIINKIRHFVEQAIQHTDPADFNQTIMDAGATVCTPARPSCASCPFQQHCFAFTNNAVNNIPNKTPKPPVKKRYFHYFDIQLPSGKMLIRQRQGGDIWRLLYELPLFETDKPAPLSFQELRTFRYDIFYGSCPPDISWSVKHVAKQKLTHQEIHAHIYSVMTDIAPSQIKHDFYLVDREKVSNFAFPKLLSDYIKTADF